MTHSFIASDFSMAKVEDLKRMLITEWGLDRE